MRKYFFGLLALSLIQVAQAEVTSKWIDHDSIREQIYDLTYEKIIVGHRELNAKEIRECQFKSSEDDRQACLSETKAIWQSSLVLVVGFEKRHSSFNDENCRFMACKETLSISLPESTLTKSDLELIKNQKDRAQRLKLAHSLFVLRKQNRSVEFSSRVGRGCDYNSDGEELRCAFYENVIESKMVPYLVIDKK